MSSDIVLDAKCPHCDKISKCTWKIGSIYVMGFTTFRNIPKPRSITRNAVADCCHCGERFKLRVTFSTTESEEARLEFVSSKKV